MVQIGRRGTARRLFENVKKFSKITEFEFQNSGPSFFAFVMSVCVSVCPLANHASKLHKIFCTCYLWPFLGLPMTTIEYVMHLSFDVIFSHNAP